MYYGQWNPPVDAWIHTHFFPDYKNGFFIEAGACDGLVENSCKFFEETMGWIGINIEPDVYNYNKLCINRPNSINLNMGLSDQEADVSFLKAVHPTLGEAFGNGSIKHHELHKKELLDQGCTFQKHTIHVITYKQLIEKHNVKNVDLMVLDVEGHELSALEGMKGCSVMPKVMCVEHGVLGVNTITSKMLELEYEYVNSSFNNSFYIKKI